MHARTTTLLLILLSTLIASCADQTDTTVGTFLVTTERTDDAAAWNARYEAKAEVRAARGISEVLTAEDIDRPGTVVTIQSVGDASAALQYLKSDESILRTSDVTAVGMIELGPMPERPVAIVIVRGRTDDFDAWKTGSDAGAAVRAGAGLHTAGVGRELGNTSHLFQAYFATDLEAARNWAADAPAVVSLTPVDGAPVVRFVDPIN